MIRRRFFFVCVSILCILPREVSAKEEPKKSATAKIPVICQASDREEVFFYTLLSGERTQGYLQTERISLKDGEMGVFEIVYCNPGKYSYRIIQEQGENAEILYDSTIYLADVYVTEEGLQMQAEVVLYTEEEDEKKEGCSFVNLSSSGTGKTQDDPITIQKAIVKTGDKMDPAVWIKLEGGAILLCLIVFGIGARRES